jgi:hypothetical protein
MQTQGWLIIYISRCPKLSDPEMRTQALLTVPKTISDSIDEEAARHFSIYAEQAKVNGYGFQAHLIEQKVVPQIESSLADIDSEEAAFNAQLLQEVRDIVPNRWQWRQMAQKVDLVHEYVFIYTFCSKLLHATPASITTDQKNLELNEIALFLKYINVKLTDIIELTREYPKKAG